jgi:hypothetical protein
MGTFDWAAIGGRYTGSLMPLPGKTGKTYGDAMSPLTLAATNWGISDKRSICTRVRVVL